MAVTNCCAALKVDPEDFRWLQPKPKDSKDSGDAKVCRVYRVDVHPVCSNGLWWLTLWQPAGRDTTRRRSLCCCCCWL
jgi:hypothetical protein